jgi:cytochrome c oxidase cbb3-type subunit 2
MDLLNKHQKVEKNSILMLILIVIVVAIGGIVEIVPLFRLESGQKAVKGVRPYTPLELAGYNIYIREGCYNCHSQQIRPLRDEVERYGHYSVQEESMYDHPFQWGSKRTGPDLARLGGKYSDEWHVQHMENPRSVVPESIMPRYAFLKENVADLKSMDKHLKTLEIVGVPYSEEMIANAYNDAIAQASADVDTSGLKARYGEKVNTRDFDGQPNVTSELDALIAYLQVLGTMAEFEDKKGAN